MGAGIAIPPMIAGFGVGLMNGTGIFVTARAVLPNIASTSKPPKRLINIAAAAETVIEICLFTPAQPRGSHCVRTVPSARW